MCTLPPLNSVDVKIKAVTNLETHEEDNTPCPSIIPHPPFKQDRPIPVKKMSSRRDSNPDIQIANLTPCQSDTGAQKWTRGGSNPIKRI